MFTSSLICEQILKLRIRNNIDHIVYHILIFYVNRLHVVIDFRCTIFSIKINLTLLLFIKHTNLFKTKLNKTTNNYFVLSPLLYWLINMLLENFWVVCVLNFLIIKECIFSESNIKSLLWVKNFLTQFLNYFYVWLYWHFT